MIKVKESALIGFFSVACSIRDITAEVGAAVIQAAVAEELAEGHGDIGPRELRQMSKVWIDFNFLSSKLHPFFSWLKPAMALHAGGQ